MIVENPAELKGLEYKRGENFESYLYFLWFENEIVYIGETTTVQSRVAAHKNDKLFDKVTYEVYTGKDKKEMRSIERLNIDFYKPIYNDSTFTILKKTTWCLYRCSGRYRIYNIGTEYLSEGVYYDGKTLQEIYHVSNYVAWFEDGIEIKRKSARYDKMEFYIENGRLETTFIVYPPPIKFVNKSNQSKNRTYGRSKVLYLTSKLTFGKYKGKTVENVIKSDVSYFKWFKTIYEGVIHESVLNVILYEVI